MNQRGSFKNPRATYDRNDMHLAHNLRSLSLGQNRETAFRCSCIRCNRALLICFIYFKSLLADNCGLFRVIVHKGFRLDAVEKLIKVNQITASMCHYIRSISSKAQSIDVILSLTRHCKRTWHGTASRKQHSCHLANVAHTCTAALGPRGVSL